MRKVFAYREEKGARTFPFRDVPSCCSSNNALRCEYLRVTLAKDGDSSPFVHCPCAPGLGCIGGSMSRISKRRALGHARGIRLLVILFFYSLSFFFFTKFFAFYVQNYENNASCCYYRGYCYGRTWLWTNSYVLTPIVNVRPRSLSNEFVARSLMPSCQRDTSTVLCFVFFFFSFNEIRYAFRSRCCFNTLPSRTLKAYRLKWTTRFIDFSRPHR